MQPGEHLYLVGGAVRDALLSTPNHDLDFVCAGDPRIIGRKLAEKLSGAFYMLDDERNACRVIAKNGHNGRLIFDFTQLRGQTLKDDLLERDFTINAMAVDLNSPSEVIDPLNGSKDLFQKWLRPCKVTSFKDDALRVVRAIRYSVKYHLRIEQSTINLLMAEKEKLSLVSKERKRDELFKIFEIEEPWAALELFTQFNILEHVCLSGIPDMHHAITRLKIFTELVSSLKAELSGEGSKGFRIKSFETSFSEMSPNLCERFSQVNQSERSIHALNDLMALLWDLDEVKGLEAAQGLALSREEQEHIVVSIRYRHWILDQFSSRKDPDRRFLYHYFRALGIAGLDVAVMTLVEAASDPSPLWANEHWTELLSFCQKLVETWFVNPEYVNPKLFITGRDLMFDFDIPQGPHIGQLLEGLREEQAIGLIQNRTQALTWVENQLQKGFIKG
ncbi:MAG: hypothetical protein ACD_34C00369G0003 [uncultured bacterium]|nr:MAG: hypothetical protein ACD_34C00369G0003 [uncultured bacterium]